jgi:hypothetical protein
MSHADRRVSEWLFLLTLAVYAYFHGGGGWNQNSQLDLTRAMAERHTFAIDAYASNTGDLSFANGHVYTNKSPALSWIAAAPYALLNAVESARVIDVNDIRVVTINAYLCTLLCVALPGALIPALLYALARRRNVPALPAALAALATALGTQLFPYATLFMLHVPSALLLTYALVGERRMLAGFAAGVATAMNYLCAVGLLFVFVRKRDRAFVAGAIPPLLALAAYHQVCFGSFLSTGIAHENRQFLSERAFFGVFQLPTIESMYGVTLSPYRGVFFFAPLLLVAFFGFAAWWRDRRVECALALTAIAALFAFNVSFNGWEAGFGVGGRYLVPLIPLFGIAIVYARRMRLMIALGVVSLVLNFTAAAVDPQPSGTIPRPVSQYLLPLLITGQFSDRVPITPPWSAATFTGHTSVNRMTFDEAVVFSRHAPDSDPSEWASFNLGEPLTGSGDLRSLIPIVLIILAGGFAIARMARRSTTLP